MYRLWRWNERTCKYCNFGGVRVAHLFYFYFYFYFVYLRSVSCVPSIVDVSEFFQFVLPLRFSLTFILLSVLLRFTDSDYPFGIFKLFLYSSARKLLKTIWCIIIDTPTIDSLISYIHLSLFEMRKISAKKTISGDFSHS